MTVTLTSVVASCCGVGATRTDVEVLVALVLGGVVVVVGGGVVDVVVGVAEDEVVITEDEVVDDVVVRTTPGMEIERTGLEDVIGFVVLGRTGSPVCTVSSIDITV